MPKQLRGYLAFVCSAYGWWSAWQWVWIWIEPTALARWCPSIWWLHYVIGVLGAWFVAVSAMDHAPIETPPTAQ